jgi:Tfp pilus assembly protein PilN
MTLLINFLPWREALLRKKTRRAYSLVATTLCLCFPVWFSSIRVIDLYRQEFNAGIEQLRTEHNTVEFALKQQEERQHTLNQLKQTLTILHSIDGQKNSVYRLLAFLSQVIREGTFLEAVVVKGRKVILRGRSRDPALIDELTQTISSQDEYVDVDIGVISTSDLTPNFQSFSVSFQMEPFQQ